MQIKYGGIPFHGSAHGKYHFLYFAGFNTPGQRINLQIGGANTIHRRNKAAQHMVYSVILVSIFNSHYIAGIFYYT